MEILQNLDECILKTRNLETVFDMANKADGANLDPNVLQQSTNKSRARFGILKKIFPKVVVALLFGKLDSILDIAKTFNNQCQCLPIVSHTAQQEDHFQHKVSLFANVVCHLEIVVLASAQKVDQPERREFRIQFYLPDVTYKKEKKEKT